MEIKTCLILECSREWLFIYFVWLMAFKRKQNIKMCIWPLYILPWSIKYLQQQFKIIFSLKISLSRLKRQLLHLLMKNKLYSHYKNNYG
jgi:hypothetical protein